jgi:hypothetical protein
MEALVAREHAAAAGLEAVSSIFTEAERLPTLDQSRPMVALVVLVVRRPMVALVVLAG